MPYLIDGHNLIPKIPGLSLSAVDDEIQLIGLLRPFCLKHRKKAEVFFDQAPAGEARQQNVGLVTAYFIRQGRTADDAIRSRLVKLGRNARNWTVVSSDRAVQAAAREVHAQVLTSESFAQELLHEVRNAAGGSRPGEAEPISDEEVEYWLNRFNPKRRKK